MLDLTLIKDLTEIIGNNLTSPDIEIIGAYFFKKYDTHILEGIPKTVTISPLRAAKRLVEECLNSNKIHDLVSFTIELDNSGLNGRTVRLAGLDNFLYRLTLSGFYFNYSHRKLLRVDEDAKMLNNWGVLRDGREYGMIVASIDVCENSKLVKKYKPSIMEKVYYSLWDFFSAKLYRYDGRIWSWAGDGGLLAFRDTNGGIITAVSCCLELLFSLSIFNCLPNKSIEESISIRIGMDCGKLRFFSQTGRIVSDVINYASHLEKNCTNPNGLSISNEMYKRLNPPLQAMFRHTMEFEGRTAHSLIHDCSKALC